MRVVFIVVMVAIVSLAAMASTSVAVVPSPNNGPGINSLTGVSCARARSCMAVGFYDDIHRAVNQTLIESGRGKRWSIVASPNAGTGDNEFLGVSCASARSCEAVGFEKANGTYQTLIESWNGVRWSIAPSPNFGTVNNILDGVSCASATSCEAVGYYFDSTIAVQSTLIESWNGIRWSIVPSPNRALAANILYGVSCVSSTSCEAVGYSINQFFNAGAVETLIESWNGVGWSIVPSPNNGTNASYLLSASCVSANACQAVGQYFNVGLANYQTLIESWNGTGWAIVPSPNRGTNVNDLLGVSCTSARACEAVGLYVDTNVGTYQSLVESWNGINWSLVPSANRGTAAYNALEAVSCQRHPGSCTAVGNYFNTTLNANQTLVETDRNP